MALHGNLPVKLGKMGIKERICKITRRNMTMLGLKGELSAKRRLISLCQ